MKSTWAIWIDGISGYQEKFIETFLSLSIAKVANGIGAWSLSLPAIYIEDGYLQKDKIFEFWRNKQLISVGFLRKWSYRLDSGVPGGLLLNLSGPDCQYPIDGRIINQAAWQSDSQMIDVRIDTMIKEIIRHSMGPDADTSRDLTSVGFSIEGDMSEAPVATQFFEWSNVYETVVKLANASYQAGTRLYFWVEPFFLADKIQFLFRTKINYIGVDRSAPNGQNPIIFSPDLGNLSDPEYVVNYMDEKNVAYVAGKGEGADRPYTSVTDQDSIATSPWSRREMFVNASNATDTDGLTNAGQSALKINKAKITLTGNVISTSNYEYGKDWGFGDWVTMQFVGKGVNGMINSLKFDVGESGSENITAKISGDVA